MFEDDLEDNYLLEAVEAVESLQPNEIVSGTSAPNSEYNSLVSYGKFITPSKIKTDDFRSRLLQTLCNKEKILTKASLIQDKSSSISSGTEEPSTSVIPKELAWKNEKNINYDNTLKDIHPITNNSIFSSSRTISLNNIEVPKSKCSVLKFSPISQDKFNHSTNANNLSITPIVRKRKFPGPAGLLPYWTQDCKPDPITSSLENEEIQEESFYNENTICSQNSATDFCNAWKQMTVDLYEVLRFNPMQLVNIRWLLRRVTFRGDVVAQKIPFLVVMIQSIDLSHQDATAVFKDETGEMNGIISHTVVEEYTSLISQGTVFILKDVTILSPDGFRVCISLRGQQRKHYINVTVNSIVRLYSLDDNGGVTKTVVSELKKDELRASLTNINKSEPKSVVEENEQEGVNIDPLGTLGGSVQQYQDKNFVRPECVKIPAVKSYQSQKFATAPLENRFCRNNVVEPSAPKPSLQKSYSPHSPIPNNFLNSGFSQNKNCVPKNILKLDNEASRLQVKENPTRSSFNAFSSIETSHCNKVARPTIPTSTSNIMLSSNEKKFRFVNKKNLSSDSSHSPFTVNFNTVISEEVAPVLSDNTKQSSTVRQNYFQSNIATDINDLSNKKQKVDVDDDDEDFDLLLSSIDTDSIMKNIL